MGVRNNVGALSCFNCDPLEEPGAHGLVGNVP